jgi:hypothetical protein
VTNAAGEGIGWILMNYTEKLAKEQDCIGKWLVSGLGREESPIFYKELVYQINSYRFVKLF